MAYWESPGKSNDWFTPSYIFEALDCIFDLDVAAPEIGGFVPARSRISSGSLEKPWEGFIWMNPPFGGRNGLEPWLRRFIEHGDGIALTPDRTSAPWFRTIWGNSDLVMFMPKVRFMRADGSYGGSPNTGTALSGIGPRACAALSRGARKGLGVLAIPVRP